LKYTFRFGDQFIEPDDDWLKCVENTSDELLGAYSKSEDNALYAAFGSRKKKRLNRIFDAIGFVYPDYRYPPRGQKRKGATSGKAAASAASSEPAPKRKKLKVLTHRLRYIERAIVPEFGGETSSPIEARGPAPTQRIEEPAAMPKTDKIEEPRIEGTKTLEVLSPKPFGRSDGAKGTKRSNSNPQEKKDGQCTRCAGDDKSFKLYSMENC
jgi:hypothetical protein